MKPWRVIGFDTFERFFYELCEDNEHETEGEARQAAQRRLEYLELTQPADESGGQGLYGIQDQVFIVRPDGSRYRFLGLNTD